MKKCCIVHIGMNKTGSSSIQESLGTHLSDPNFSYISLSSHNHSGKIVSLFMESPENLHSHVKRGLTLKQINAINEDTHQRLIKNFIETSAETQIISGEGISKLSESELLEFKIFLKTYFKKVSIVAYYRLPYAFMQSAFQQRVKGGLNKFNIKNMYPNYRNLFEKFDKVFGRENVSLWKFEPKEFMNGDVVLDFCNRLNIDTTTMKIKRENEALSLEALSLLYCYHKFGDGYGVGKKVIQENELLIKVLNTIGNKKFILSHTLTESILHKRKDDLDWIEQRTGIKLGEKQFTSADGVSKESDLINIAIESKKELSKLLIQYDVMEHFDVKSPEMIAKQIQALRMSLSQNFYKEVL